MLTFNVSNFKGNRMSRVCLHDKKNGEFLFSPLFVPVDWRRVDWTKDNLTLSVELDRSPNTVKNMRYRVAPRKYYKYA